MGSTMDGTRVQLGSVAPARPLGANREVLDGVIAELNEIERRSGIERTLAVGELILARFFGSDPDLWRDRRRNKNNSIRRLASRADCPLGRSALNEAVAIYVAVVELPCVRTFGHVGASHVASVLSLPIEQRLNMLESAERERLSVRELRKQVVGARRAGGERRGRPGLDATSRSVAALESDLRRLSRSIGQLEPWASFADEARERIRHIALSLVGLSNELGILAGSPVRSRSSVVHPQLTTPPSPVERDISVRPFVQRP